MTVKDYALESKKDVKTILQILKDNDINVNSENDELDDEAIVLLDIICGSVTTEEAEEVEVDENLMSKYEFEDRAESMLEDSNLNIVHEKKEKIKKKDSFKEKEEYLKSKKNLYKHKQKLESNVETLKDNVVLYKEGMTVNDLANLLNVNVAELVKKLVMMGLMISANQSISFDDAALICLEYDKELKKEETADISNFEQYEISDSEEDLVERPPVVTIMGHVDHGKTTLLDYIRKTNVVSGEAGGITQAIGAYQVEQKGKRITFIDTPGHAAFTEMRARGASITDIVIIIVAADDGVMPQTKEAVDHAKAANVPIIVAINKIDKGIGNIDRIMSEFAEMGLNPEEWGGDTIFVKLSAHTGEGVDLLLDNIIALAEIQNLRSNPNAYSTGTVIEARLDKKVGPVTTLLIGRGTLRLGDPIVVGTAFGKVRTLKNDAGKDITEALPSTPVEITGLNDVPVAGDKFMAFETEKQAREIALKRQENEKSKKNERKPVSLDDLFDTIKEGKKEINIVLKADVKGSEEAVKNNLEKINVEGVKVSVIRSGVGTITESDVILANASNAIIIGFNVMPSSATKEIAERYNVDIRLYNIIYKAIEEIEAAMKGMLDPEYEEVTLGEAEVRQLFKFSKVGTIAGSHVTSGIIKSNSKARIIRDGVIIFDSKIKSLQREKNEVKEVKNGFDCGITIENFNDIKENDVIQAYEMKEVKK